MVSVIEVTSNKSVSGQSLRKKTQILKKHIFSKKKPLHSRSGSIRGLR